MPKTAIACPPFCTTKNDPVGCDDHHSDVHDQPATAGDYYTSDGRAEFPLVTTNAMRTADGQPGVCLLVSSPTLDAQFRPGSTEAKMTPREARQLARDLILLADLSEVS